MQFEYLDRQAWFSGRKKLIGGSEVAAILGLSKWKSPLSVYADKVLEQEEQKPSEVMEWGHRLESAIAQKFFEEHPEYSMPAPMRVVPVAYHPKHKFLAASPDRILFNAEGKEIVSGLECKTSGPWANVDWEAGELPIEYQLQVMHYLYVMGMPHWWVAALVAGQKYFEFKVAESNHTYETKVLPELLKFWEMVESRTPPAIIGAPGEKEAVQKLFPLKAGEIEATQTIAGYVDLYRQGKQMEAEGAALKEKAQTQIRAAMAGAELCVGDKFKITDKLIEKKEYTVKASSSRQLRITIKGGKEA